MAESRSRVHGDPTWAEGGGHVALQDIAGAHREEQTLYEIAQALGSSLGVAEAMADSGQGQRLVPCVTCALFLGDDAEATCAAMRTAGHRSAAQVDAAVVERNRATPCRLRRRPRPHGEELTSLLPCPLRFEGRVIGEARDTTQPQPVPDEHRSVLGRVSEQAAAVIFNSTRFEQTQHESQPTR